MTPALSASRPQRMQLSRAKGFRLQEASRALNGLPAVKVDRSTKWGNPFPVGIEGPFGRLAPDNAGAAGFFEAMMGDPDLRAAANYPDIAPLCGKNLACWCALPKPGQPDHCHAAVLLALASPICEEVTGCR